MNSTSTLAAFAAELDLRGVDEVVRHEAKRALLDHLGVALAGSTDPGVDALLGVAHQVGSTAQATVIGRPDRLGVPWAALLNGYEAHVLDYDDTYNPGRTTVHGSAPVWPAVLALGEDLAIDGATALTAFVAGFELEVRVARAAGPAHYDVGWHVTGTVGRLGAAAAACRILGLDRQATVAALGTAGTQAAGLKQVYGSMGKAFHPGKAAFDGILAARLAAAGFTSTDEILEGPTGFLRVLSVDADPAELDRDLGATWYLLENGYKLAACGSLMHPVIDAILELRRGVPIEPRTVESIEALVHPNVARVTNIERPTTGLEGKFSIRHAAAVAMLDGAAHIAQFSDERVRAADAAAMRDRVSIRVDESLSKQGSKVTVRTSGGTLHRAVVTHNRGTPGNPVADGELEEKFLSLARPRIGADAARSVAAAIWELEAIPDLSRLTAPLGGDARP